jgi:hypothetical protein
MANIVPRKEKVMNYENAVEELSSYIFTNYEECFLSGDEPDEIVDMYLEDNILIQDLEDFGIDSRTIDLDSIRYSIEERLWEKFNKKYKKGEM